MKEYICPSCKNPIYDEEVLSCHFCGESLHRTSSGMMGKMRGGFGHWVSIFIAILIVVTFLLLMFR